MMTDENINTTHSPEILVTQLGNPSPFPIWEVS